MLSRPIIEGLTPKTPVHTIFCIGRNYAEHALELNNLIPTSPVVFTKPLNSIIGSGGSIIIPPFSNDVHHEVEVVVAIGKGGKNISEAKALNYIFGYGIGIDVTARDVQQKLKDKSHPWDVAKGADTFAPISNFLPANRVPNPFDLELELKVNEEVKQSGSTKDLIFSIPFLISYLSTIFTLQSGDLIFTGTPKGVGPLAKGDKLKATLGDNLVSLNVDVKI
ncbi:MAG: fumarylacetoacetate hydrolase family protein [Balneolales bacterium]